MENVDRAFVAGTHYAAADFVAALPAIPCFDGVGRLTDGTLVGFGGLKPPAGALAERVVVPAGYAMPIPDGIAPEIARLLGAGRIVATGRDAGALHEATHRVPGVPDHSARTHGHAMQGKHPRPQGRHPRLQGRIHHQHREPRVLVAWQNRIARLFGALRARP
ncbi:hypothetical protein KNO15_07300 [Leifsonia shinshuensis]|uniref:hypothetical protein n=1 Tax=Leifsonia shinshuensis TaxID=150026 RepID=UPI001F50C3AC|nr:hypothetical protein [Leifsonia shinshuensis]MCI0156500.1 hypothetical protein [Leifsonia shinshuensis]